MASSPLQLRLQPALLVVCLSLAGLISCAARPVGSSADSLPASEEAEYAAFEAEIMGPAAVGLQLERESSIFAASQEQVELAPFVNPAGVITVPIDTNFTILVNHTVAGGGTTAFWNFVTQIGSVPCPNIRSQLSATPSCNDSTLTYFGLQNVNIDGTYMTAQFLYTFVTSSTPGESSLQFCTFRPWEACAGQPTMLKVITTAPTRPSADEDSIFAINRQAPKGAALLPQSQEQPVASLPSNDDSSSSSSTGPSPGGDPVDDHSRAYGLRVWSVLDQVILYCIALRVLLAAMMMTHDIGELQAGSQASLQDQTSVASGYQQESAQLAQRLLNVANNQPGIAGLRRLRMYSLCFATWLLGFAIVLSVYLSTSDKVSDGAYIALSILGPLPILLGVMTHLCCPPDDD